MPLEPINIAAPYFAVFGTVGPLEESAGDATLKYLNDYWASIRTLQHPIRLKFETGSTGYKHAHFYLFFHERTKYAKFVKSFQQFLKSQFPNSVDAESQFSVRLFAIPLQSKENGLTGKALCDHYFDNPTKEKCTEGGSYVLDHDGYNFMEDINNEKNPKKKKQMIAFHKAWIKNMPPHKEIDFLSARLFDAKMDWPKFAASYHEKKEHPESTERGRFLLNHYFPISPLRSTGGRKIYGKKICKNVLPQKKIQAPWPDCSMMDFAP